MSQLNVELQPDVFYRIEWHLGVMEEWSVVTIYDAKGRTVYKEFQRSAVAP